MKSLLFVFTLLALIQQLSATEPPQFKTVDGIYIKGEFIDTNPNTHERLFLRYPIHYDGGAELELTAGDSLVWRECIPHLGIAHSVYRQDASMVIIGGLIYVTITGAKTIKEIRELKTGKLISRTVEENTSK